MVGKVFAIASKYLRPDGVLEIGGIETYLTQLGVVLAGYYELTVYQPSATNFERRIGDVMVIGRISRNYQALTDHVVGQVLRAGDILLISTEQLNAAPRGWPQALVIQHGIYWDLPSEEYATGYVGRRFPNSYKVFDNYRNIRRIKPHKNVVCVDYAYIQWLRALTGDGCRDKRVWVIPNSASEEFYIGPPVAERGSIGILFARRFIPRRGTRVFANVAARLVRAYPNVRITLSGDGPEEAGMRAILPPSDRVCYGRTAYDAMATLISQHDIVVVPSLGSEGTSLSVLEGMAAGRAVVASAVGGITSAVIDSFNGLLVPPGDEEALHDALVRLITSSDLRLRLGGEARSVARAQFSIHTWGERWLAVLHQLGGGAQS